MHRKKKKYKIIETHLNDKGIWMRFFIFIILCFFSFSVYAEQLKIEDGVFINIPDNKVYTVINANELVKGVIEARDLTQQESAIVEFIHKKGGQSSDDVVYYIQSQKNKEFYEKEDDPFGKAENDILFYRITEKCLEKFTKKGVHKCARREFSSVMNNDPSYQVVLLKNDRYS